ncbi:MAG: hypothetical protein LBE84_08560, partial [Planctomycetota bacterium]|nr:hypothetical protein [Planctomycetota bacterium]
MDDSMQKYAGSSDREQAVFRVEVATQNTEDDIEARNALHELREYGLSQLTSARSSRIYAIRGNLTYLDIDRIAGELLTDPVLEMFSVNQTVFPELGSLEHMIEIARRSGVMEPSETSALKVTAALGLKVDQIRLGWRYIFNGPVSKSVLYTAVLRILANPVIEKVAIDSELNLM